MAKRIRVSKNYGKTNADKLVFAQNALTKTGANKFTNPRANSRRSRCSWWLPRTRRPIL